MGKYDKDQNTIACRKWRQKNKWILKMKARERRAKKKSSTLLVVAPEEQVDGQLEDMQTSSSDSLQKILNSIPDIKRGSDL